MVVPRSCTSGELAQILGVTERLVAGRRQDGRLPVTSEGRIDLAAVIRAGLDELAGRNSAYTRGRGGPTPAEAGRALERLAIWLTVQSTPEHVAGAALRVGVPLDKAKALYRDLLHTLPDVANLVRSDLMGLSEGELGPFDAMTHLPEPDWDAVQKSAHTPRK